jgi:hypothetical protein
MIFSTRYGDRVLTLVRALNDRAAARSWSYSARDRYRNRELSS